MSVDKALQHRWFSEVIIHIIFVFYLIKTLLKNILKTSDKDSQVYFDLAELENKVQLKWLTTLEQQQKWLIPDSIHL
jgi:hypothetical protein